MSMEEKKTRGNLKISESVIETISAAAASETAGVAALVAAPNLKGTLKSSAPESSIVVKMVGDVARIDVYVKLLKGAVISEVGENIQTNVKNQVQNQSKVVVEKVNVIVVGILEEA